jgi:hypothetical protein
MVPSRRCSLPAPFRPPRGREADAVERDERDADEELAHDARVRRDDARGEEDDDDCVLPFAREPRGRHEA